MTDLLDLLATSRRNVDLLASPSALMEAASQIGTFASSCGATQLVAASPQAERVVGAALLLLGQREPCEPAARTSRGTVVVVDINIASGTAMAETVRRVREGGANKVQGFVLHALYGAVGPVECGLDTLQILERPTVTCER